MQNLGVRFGFVQRSKKQTAINRSSYQRHRFILDGSRVKLFHTDDEKVLYSKDYCPASAPDWAFSTSELWTKAAKGERRCDGIEGRTFDLTVPRILSESTQIQICDRIAQAFVKLGIAVQVDIHNAPASDGGRNIHAHFLLATRTIDQNGFSKKKSLELEKIFNKRRGRDFRERLADLINRHSIHEIGNPIVRADRDPENLKPEPRLPRWYAKSKSGQEFLSLRRQIPQLPSLRETLSNKEHVISSLDAEIEEFDELISALVERRADAPANFYETAFYKNDELPDSPEDRVEIDLDPEEVADFPMDSVEDMDWEADEPNDEPFDFDEPEY